MIVYDKLWETMAQKGVSKYKLREHYYFEQRTLRKLKLNENVETNTLDKLCNILDCNIEDIATFIKGLTHN
jgi:DNA-binding Xre family transcriptional regulator